MLNSVQLAPKFGNGPAKIRVVSDDSTNLKGFELRYQVIPSDPCRSSPCLHGGSCQQTAAGYECTCADGFSGEYCEIIEDPCISDPCQNGGQCQPSIETGYGYICQCEIGYEGDQCQVQSETTTTDQSTTSSGLLIQ